MKSSVARLLVLIQVLSVFRSDAYRPVILVHALFGDAKSFDFLTQFIQTVHPGTEVFALDLFSKAASVRPLWTQVKAFSSAVEAIVNRTSEAHLLCYSQGGLICRALLSVMPNHNIHTFIALGSPLAGQYGITSVVNRFFPRRLKKDVYKMCYCKLGQLLSICQYWNDPHRREKYLKYSNFLALINGEKEHKDSTVWKENFLKIKKLVLVGGPDDGIITPWQSSFFGFYNSSETVVEMKDQEFYRSDVFGLKTLDSRGDLAVCVQSGVIHQHFHVSFRLFRNCVQDWLT